MTHPWNFNNLKESARAVAARIEEQLRRVDFEATGRADGHFMARTTYERGDITVVAIISHRHDDPPIDPDA